MQALSLQCTEIMPRPVWLLYFAIVRLSAFIKSNPKPLVIYRTTGKLPTRYCLIVLNLKKFTSGEYYNLIVCEYLQTVAITFSIIMNWFENLYFSYFLLIIRTSLVILNQHNILFSRILLIALQYLLRVTN